MIEIDRPPACGPSAGCLEFSKFDKATRGAFAAADDDIRRRPRNWLCTSTFHSRIRVVNY
ncbi:hypothetical protein [Mycolicibacterium vinylchloridicum]|uniref:hypothetical protein n=1 Tax=Mycolicibacterium vinylchloridicum TaxID=2736928 RepID=UPI0015C71DF9|nr:hypothetical protein [Mycolicibacterium vinylchloridicum]